MCRTTKKQAFPYSKSINRAALEISLSIVDFKNTEKIYSQLFEYGKLLRDVIDQCKMQYGHIRLQENCLSIPVDDHC